MGGEPTSRARAEDFRFETDGAATCPLASRDRDMRPVTSSVAPPLSGTNTTTRNACQRSRSSRINKSGHSIRSSINIVIAIQPGTTQTAPAPTPRVNALFRLLLLALSQNVGYEMNYKCTVHKLPYLCPSLPVTPPE